MNQNKKNGFTLVELLAVIVILAIILVIAVPQIMSTIKDTTKASLESSAKMVAAQVEKQYTVAQTLGKEFESTGSCKEDWAGLNDVDYASCTYEITDNGTAEVTISGKGKFKNLSVCSGTRSSATAIEGECEDNSGVAYIAELLTQSAEYNGLIEDDTTDKNIRYVGSDPNNYVYFNCEDTYNGKSYGSEGYEYDDACEIWRIIGVFNVARTKGGKSEKRIKIIRDPFEKADGSTLAMSWDSSASNINSGWGVNEWSQADLMNILNTYYLGTTNSCTYCNSFNQATCPITNNCASYIKPLSTITNKMIDTAVWSTRRIEDNTYTAQQMYELEKNDPQDDKDCSPTYYDGSINPFCTDTVIRKEEWEGKIGLMYPSDWGYASADTNCTYITDGYGTCIESNWIYKPGETNWTILPYADDVGQSVWVVNNCSYRYDANNIAGVRPTTYLKSTIQIVDGEGTDDYPFILK